MEQVNAAPPALEKKLPLLTRAAHAGRGSIIFPSGAAASPVVPRPCSGAEHRGALPKSASRSPARAEAARAASLAATAGDA